ncbi:MAG: ATP-binding protein, partial [Ramlibacter sp.]
EHSPEITREVQRMNAPDGSMRPYEVQRQAFKLEGRWIIAATWRDIQEREAAQEELRRHMEKLARSNQELEQFAYVTSHDLSEPLRMMSSYAELLKRRYGDKLGQDADEFIGFIVDGARRMKRLIDDLLLYSRTGREPAIVSGLPLDVVVDDALMNLHAAIEESGATISREPLPRIAGDRVGLVQLFQNLLGNAIKFRGDAPPRLSIGVQATEAEWTISVADNGIGIAPEYFERIFLLFQRLHSQTQYEGTGIGLSICKRIVERHGGRIWVESPPGGGSVFKFTVPREVAVPHRPGPTPA